MTTFAAFETIETDSREMDADVPFALDYDDFAPVSALCDMDGIVLKEGQMVQMSGSSVWYEIDLIKPGSRRVEVIGPDGSLLDVLATDVAVSGI